MAFMIIILAEATNTNAQSEYLRLYVWYMVLYKYVYG